MAATAKKSSIRVLIADDHALMREGLRAILALEPDIEVVGEAADGLEAVELAERLHPEIVIMDLAMPGVSGVEATRRIRERDRRIAVLALSSHSDSRFVSESLRAGASAYVLKMNAFRELRRGILALHRGQSYLCPGVAETAARIIRDKDAPPETACERLGSREREILQLLAEGLSSGKIASRLHISVSTVDSHRRNIMRKLDCSNVVELTRFAIREGLSSLDD